MVSSTGGKVRSEPNGGFMVTAMSAVVVVVAVTASPVLFGGAVMWALLKHPTC